MKIAICYYSKHHGNTKTVLDALVLNNEITLIDILLDQTPNLSQYDIIGFASGIYFSKFSDSIIKYVEKYLPDGKNVFFIYTCGSNIRKEYTKNISDAAKKKNAHIIDEYGCRGFDTFGPFKLVGGIAKGHPSTTDIENAKLFFIKNILQ